MKFLPGAGTRGWGAHAGQSLGLPGQALFWVRLGLWAGCRGCWGLQAGWTNNVKQLLSFIRFAKRNLLNTKAWEILWRQDAACPPCSAPMRSFAIRSGAQVRTRMNPAYGSGDLLPQRKTQRCLSSQYFWGPLVSTSIHLNVVGTRNLKYWVLGPSGRGYASR